MSMRATGMVKIHSNRLEMARFTMNRFLGVFRILENYQIALVNYLSTKMTGKFWSKNCF